MIPLTGSFTSAQLRAELGLGDGPVSFTGDTLAKLRRLTNTPAGTIPVIAARGAHMVLADAVQQVVKDMLGNPAAAGTFRVVVEPGVTIGSNAPASAALDTGQLPSGSRLTLDVYGTVQGAGGTAGTLGAGGAGGHAIKANYLNQAVTIIRRSGSVIRGGGGGGGKGGNGGRGGNGGQGIVGGSTITEGPLWDSNLYAAVRRQNGAVWDWRWGGFMASTSSPSFSSGGWNYYPHTLMSTPGLETEYYSIYRATSTGDTIYPGGIGGNGGAGGVGGRGQGHDGDNGGAASGSAGAFGSAGGTNAGAGGRGGNGGGGGTGGTWGQTGFTGASGATGAAGASGNYTGGAAGSAGTAGSAGGAAGSYVHKGTASVTLVDEGGTVTGPLT